ncbi:hypothetical protein OG598_27010 [Micromonospora sp. NBC_00330]|uniref:hypothetical protein n=1 Tax=Micromonospora sp. NBC_00330 TaxID=2903585 RepID=UPI002E299653|nr:hypothetical protein [Micromonospora sp. NBC_00330]
MDEQPEPVILHLYCRVDVLVTDPAAVTGHAVADLRSAGIDWSTEEDDLDTAAEELRGEVTASLASLADISRLVDDIPGVEFRGGRCWAESGPVREAFPAR